MAPGPRVAEPGGVAHTCTGRDAYGVSDATLSSVPTSPTANVTAAAPNTTAATVTAVRAGRANGAASPSVTAPRHRMQPRQCPVREVSVTRPRRPARGDRLDGAHPAGPERRWHRAGHSAEHFISLSTVKTHITRIQNKLGARNRVEIAAWSWENRIMGE